MNEKVRSIELNKAYFAWLGEVARDMENRGITLQDVLDQVKELQFAYFTENPNCIYANPKVYKHLIPKQEAKQKDWTPIKSVIPKRILALVEDAVRTDLQYAARI